MQVNLRRPPHRTYTITQLCREFGCTPRALRFYEEQGLLFPARREMQRIFSYKDRARLQLIVGGRRLSLSLAEIRDILDLYDEEGEAVQDARAVTVFRERIEALKVKRKHVEEALETLKSATEYIACEHPELAADT